MSIRFEPAVPPIELYWDLFDATGWNREYLLSREDLAGATRECWYAVSAYDGEQLVGFGRVLSDGVLHAMIYDLIVSPSHQGRGVGTRILDMLIQQCREAKIRDIQLFSARGKREFYEHRGFVARPDDAPGMDYRQQGATRTR